jgi:hypothetical protein
VPKGIGTISFTDVAAWIDPTTVSFTDLDDATTTVLEQNFQFDLVSPSKLMERYIGRTITLAVPMGNSVSQVSGELLSANQGQLVLKTQDGLQIIPAQGAQVSLGEMPGGLLTKPTLVWKLASEKAASISSARPIKQRESPGDPITTSSSMATTSPRISRAG